MTSLYRQSFKNTIYNTIGWIWPIGLNLVTTPYVVLSLGTDVYGILGIIGVILGYFALLDMGIGAGNIKYVSEYLIKKDFIKINAVINSLFFIYLIVGIIICTSIILLSGWFVESVFKVPENMKDVASFAFKIAALGFPISLLNSVYNAVPKAFHRFDIINKIQLILGTFSTLSVVFIIYIGYGFKEVVLVKYLNSIILLIINIFVVRRLLPTYKFNLRIDKSTFHKLFAFGIWDLFIKLSNLSIGQLGRMLIGMMLGTAAVTYYIIPQSLTDRINSFTFKLSEIIFPISSQLSAENDYERLNRIYIKMTKYFLMFKLSVYIPICMLSYKILQYWIGKDFADEGYLVLIILATGYFINSLGHLGGLITYGMAKLKITAVYTIINFLIIIITIYPLIKIFGIVGSSIAYAISTVIYIHYLIYINKNLLGLNNTIFFKLAFIKPILVGFLQICILYILKPFITNFTSVIAVLMFSFLTYHLISYLYGLYERSEKEIIKEILFRKSN